jgi:hypothetical protein
MILIIIILFIVGLYFYLDSGNIHNYHCPNLLIQQGNKILLKDTNMATVPGVNPIVFHTLDEYTEYLKWQESQGKHCPVLTFQKKYDAQNEPVYTQIPEKLVDASRDHSPYNDNLYPGMDTHNQTIGQYTVLDVVKN